MQFRKGFSFLGLMLVLTMPTQIFATGSKSLGTREITKNTKPVVNIQEDVNRRKSITPQKKVVLNTDYQKNFKNEVVDEDEQAELNDGSEIIEGVELDKRDVDFDSWFPDYDEFELKDESEYEEEFNNITEGVDIEKAVADTKKDINKKDDKNIFGFAKRSRVYKSGNKILVTTKSDVLPLIDNGSNYKVKNSNIIIPKEDVLKVDNMNDIKDLDKRVARAAKINRVVGYALSQQGKPYVWGASGPSSFDCSGLVVSSYRTINVSMPRTSYTQCYAGYPVKSNELRPGDCLYFNITKSSGHVGIYIGDGLFVHAPKKGDVVKVTSLRYGNYSKTICGARRFVA